MRYNITVDDHLNNGFKRFQTNKEWGNFIDYLFSIHDQKLWRNSHDYRIEMINKELEQYNAILYYSGSYVEFKFEKDFNWWLLRYG